MNKETDITARYRELRDTILEVFRRAQPVLNGAKRILSKGDFELPIDKLANEKFTLTLVGAFQSGKSTLFSYLCGGWELSAVGAGIRTTGCCVTATALPEGEDNYAWVTWFDETEIKAAISDYTGRDVEDIHLDAPEWCKHFEQEVLDETKKPGIMMNKRIALLMLHFYSQYKTRCAGGKGEEYRNVGDAVPYACYPIEWEQIWERVDTLADIDVQFDEKSAAFAFCKRIDYYVDSPVLRALDCTVQDCPGLFASGRDSDLTREIIRKSDAILCTFRGDTELHEDEIQAIRDCVNAGFGGKMVLGANLHASLKKWERIEPTIASTLTRVLELKDKPEIIHYHAPLALRCIELLQLQHAGALQPESEKAIQKCIDESMKKTDTIAEYLHRDINFWITCLYGTGGADWLNEEMSDESGILWEKLRELHHVPALITHVTNTLLIYKARSILLDKGINSAVDSVKTTCDRLKLFADKLAKGKRESEEDIREQECKVREVEKRKDELSKEREAELRKIGFGRLAPDVANTVRKVIEQSEEEIIRDIDDKLPSFFDSAKGKLEKTREFERYSLRKIKEIVASIRDWDLLWVFSPVAERIEKLFEDQRIKLQELVAQKLDGIKLRLPTVTTYGEEFIKGISLPSYASLGSLLEQHNTWVNHILDKLHIVRKAHTVWNELKEGLIRYVNEVITDMLEKNEDSPLNVYGKISETFNNRCEEVCKNYLEDQKAILSTLRKTAAEKESTVRECESLREKLEDILSDLDDLKGKVKEVF